jgi:predicted MFS family arabinose efflux permease
VVNTADDTRVRRPFWLHQVVEYTLGIVLISQGLQLREPMTLTLSGVAILINAAVVAGPLSAFGWISRPAHQIGDLLLVLLLLFFGLQPLWTLDATSRSILVAVAIVMFMLWRITNYTVPTQRQPRPLRGAHKAVRSQNSGRPDAQQYGKAAGRAAGGIVRRWRQDRAEDSRQ